MIFPLLSNEDRSLPIYLVGIGRMERQEAIHRAEGFPYHQFLLVTHGSGQLTYQGHTVPLREWDCFFLPKNIPHAYHAVTPPFTTRWICFDGSGVPSILQYFNMTDIRVFNTRQATSLRMQHQALLKRAMAHESTAALSIPLYHLLMDCCTAAVQPEASSLEEVRAWICQYYGEDITLDDIAAQAGLSRYELCRSFKRAFGRTPIAYLIDIRLQNAKRLLVERRDLNIKQIGEMCGFHDAVYFGRMFRRQEHITPSAFRDTWNQL